MEGRIRCTISIGVAERKAGEVDTIECLVHRADLAMLDRRRIGRARAPSAIGPHLLDSVA
jgi:PleD family two-component response regulator